MIKIIMSFFLFHCTKFIVKLLLNICGHRTVDNTIGNTVNETWILSTIITTVLLRNSSQKSCLPFWCFLLPNIEHTQRKNSIAITYSIFFPLKVLSSHIFFGLLDFFLYVHVIFHSFNAYNEHSTHSQALTFTFTNIQFVYYNSVDV